jgi:adenylate kinase family enzyme
MKRVNVIGSPGSGKTFVSNAIGAAFGLPVVRLDALRHGPDWTEVPDELFIERVVDAAAEDRWVMDGSYPSARPVIWRRADTIIWTDVDKGTVMRQVIARSLRDWATRRETVPGNRERLRNFVKPWHPIPWAWRNHARFRQRERTWLDDTRWAHLDVVHLRSRDDIDAFIEAHCASPAKPGTVN